MTTTIETLDDLLAVLRAAPADQNDGAELPYAEAHGLPTRHGRIDWTALPTFGGGEGPDETAHVWSWDADRLLVGTSRDDLRIVPWTIECAYCGAEEPADVARQVPAVDDDAAWAARARTHDAGCEWIATRAHRLGD